MAQNVLSFSRPKSGYRRGASKAQWYHFRVMARLAGTAGYVLVGGRSSRMGRDKARLPFRGGSLADWVAREVTAAAGSAILVGDSELGIADLYPGEGPLGGILTALEHSRAEWNLIVACDMPMVAAGFLRRLIEAAQQAGCDVLAPCAPAGRLEPLCAVYRSSALQPMRARFAGGIRKVTDAFDGLRVTALKVTEVEQFQNLNTPEDWAAYAGE
jgi:molybdenum cofactor guanylyltransferase